MIFHFAKLGRTELSQNRPSGIICSNFYKSPRPCRGSICYAPGRGKILLEIFALALFLLPTLLHVKIKRAPAHSNNNQNLTAMTHIMNFATSTTSRSNRMKEYQVEVIDFDGDSHTVYVEARNEEEASDMAAEMVGNADYTMVYEVA